MKDWHGGHEGCYWCEWKKLGEIEYCNCDCHWEMGS